MTFENEIAWASGLFEGEGCFLCYKIKGRPNSFRVSVVISMTDKDVIESFCRVIGFGKVKGPYNNPWGRKQRYVWEVQNFRECYLAASMMLPYMHSRRKQKAEELISLCLERMK